MASSYPSDLEIDQEFQQLQDVWLDAELEVQALREREGPRDHEALAEFSLAKQRCAELWRLVKRVWDCAAKLEAAREAAAKAAREVQAAAKDKPIVDLTTTAEALLPDGLDEMSDPDAQGEPDHELVEYDLGGLGEFDVEWQPLPSKAAEPEEPDSDHGLQTPPPSTAVPSEPSTPSIPTSTTAPIEPATGSVPLLTAQQTEIFRNWLCSNFNKPTKRATLKSISEATGLRPQYVDRCISEFYKANPAPTREQVMAWKFSVPESRGTVANALFSDTFAKNPNPSLTERQQLAKQAGLSRAQVDKWFWDAQQCTDNTRPVFGRKYLTILRAWLEAHRDNPYPNKEQFAQLVQETGRTHKQINLWLRDNRQKEGLVAHPRFSRLQLAVLRESFDKNVYPDDKEKQRLAQKTGLAVEQVCRWFKDIRYRELTKKQK